MICALLLYTYTATGMEDVSQQRRWGYGTGFFQEKARALWTTVRPVVVNAAKTAVVMASSYYAYTCLTQPGQDDQGLGLTPASTNYGVVLASTVLSRNVFVGMCTGLMAHFGAVGGTPNCPTLNPIPPQYAQPGQEFKLELDTAKILKEQPNNLTVQVKGGGQLPNWLILGNQTIMSSNLVYIADGVAGLQIIDVSDPLNLKILGGYNTPGYAYAVKTASNFAYVADDTSLQVINISDPQNPELFDSLNMVGLGSLRMLSIQEDILSLLIYNGSSRLWIKVLNMTNKNLDLLSETITPVGNIYQYGPLATSKGIGIIIPFVDQMQLVDLTSKQNLSTLAILSTYNLRIIDLKIYGDYAFGAIDWAGGGNRGCLGVFDITNVRMPSTFIYTTNNNAPDPGRRVFVSEKIAYIVFGNSGLQLRNITNLKNISLLSAISTGGNAADLIVSGNLIYVINQGSGMQIIDATNPESPFLLNNIKTTGNAETIDFGNNFFNSFRGILSGKSTDPIGTKYDLELVGKNCVHPFTLTIGTPQTPFAAPFFAPAPSGTTTTTPIVTTNLFSQPNVTQQFQQPIGTFPNLAPGPLNYSTALSNGAPLPPWLVLTNDSKPTIIGQYTTEQAGNYYIIITATDVNGKKASETNLIRIEGPPVMNGTIPFQYAKVNQAFNYFIPKGVFSDPNFDPMTFTTSDLPRWLSFNPTTQTFAGTPQIQDRGNSNVTVSATDNISGSISTSFGLRVDNDPKLNFPIPRQYARIGKNYKYQPDPLTFVHPDKVELWYEADNNLPGWLSFSSPPPTFSGKPTEMGTYALRLKAHDNINGTAIADFALDVLDNTPPEIIGIPNVPTAPIFKYYETFVDLSKVFKDATNDVLIYKLRQSGRDGLPGWLSFNPTNITSLYRLSGKPGRSDLNFYTDKTLNLEVSATDDLGASAKTTFNMMVTGESWGKLLLKIGGPTLSGLATAYGLYKNQALILNWWNRSKYRKDSVTLDQDNTSIPLETPITKNYLLQAYVPLDPAPRGIWRFLRDDATPFPGSGLPLYMAYKEDTNSVEFFPDAFDGQISTPLVIRVKDQYGVIKEEIPVDIAGELPAQTSDVLNTEEDGDPVEDISAEPQDGYE